MSEDVTITITVAGPAGAGKTTLAYLITELMLECNLDVKVAPTAQTLNDFGRLASAEAKEEIAKRWEAISKKGVTVVMNEVQTKR